ncbi:unnamed protein product [Closterium sp. NIES-64]|nr:unnamed protein product [Closterium sp. NIES-64]
MAVSRAEMEGLSKEQLVEEVLRLSALVEERERHQKQEVDFQRDLLKSVGQSIIVTDLEGHITYWNRAATEIYGWEPEEVLGRLVFEVLALPAEDMSECGVQIFAALSRGDKWSGEWSVRTKAGNIIEIMVVDTPVMDEANQLVGVIGVSTDISELKRKEAEILRLNAELEQRVAERTQQLQESNRLLQEEVQEHLRARKHLHRVARDMEASRSKILEQANRLEKLVVDLRAARLEAESASRLKSQFLACMSHEIRTPMNAVIGMTNLILSTPLTDEQQQYVHTIRTSGDALLAIIDDILDFSKIEAGELALERCPFSLMMCLEEAVDMFALKALDKRLELVSFADPSVPPIAQTDPARVRQVCCTVKLSPYLYTSSSLLSDSALPSHELHVTVTDTGIGIPPDRMSRLFRPFSQGDASTTRRFGGTGLGLVISKQLAELLGGRMWVESAGEDRAAIAPSSAAMSSGITTTIATTTTSTSAPAAAVPPGVTLAGGSTGAVAAAGAAGADRRGRLMESAVLVPGAAAQGSAADGGVGNWEVEEGAIAGMNAGVGRARDVGISTGVREGVGAGTREGVGAGARESEQGGVVDGKAGEVVGGERRGSKRPREVSEEGGRGEDDGGATRRPVGESERVVGGVVGRESGHPTDARTHALTDAPPTSPALSPRDSLRGEHVMDPAVNPAAVVTLRPIRAVQGRTALVVDDSAAVRAMVSAHLQALGFATRELTSGEQLLEEVAACDVTRAPSLVVIDTEVSSWIPRGGGVGRVWFATRELTSGEQLLEEVAACDVTRTPSLVVVDTEMPGMDGLTAVNQLSALPQAEGLRVLLLCPYGTANQVRVTAPSISMAALTKPLRQSLFTRALLLAFPPLATPPSPSPLTHPHQPAAASPTTTPTTTAPAPAPAPAAAAAFNHSRSSHHSAMPQPSSVPPASASSAVLTAVASRTGGGKGGGGGNATVTSCGGDRSDGRTVADAAAAAAAAAAGGGGGSGSNVSSIGVVSPRARGDGGRGGQGGRGGEGREGRGGQGAAEQAGAVEMPRRNNSWQNLIAVGVVNERTTPGGFILGLADKHPLKILLVEDNLVNQRVATRMLSNMGYTVDLAVNGLEAVNAIATKTYDLVFMDIQMPVMDGIEATQRIHLLAQQEGRVRPRIVAMTANVLHSDRQQCLNAGMDGFLSKPIRVADLVAGVIDG